MKTQCQFHSDDLLSDNRNEQLEKCVADFGTYRPKLCIPVISEEKSLVDFQDKNNVKCPKCSCRQIESDSCIRCGIIVSKFISAQNRKAENQKKTHYTSENLPQINLLIYSRQPKNHIFSFICIILLMPVFFYFSFCFFPLYLEAKKFEKLLPLFGARYCDFSQNENTVSEGEVPYRTGKLFIVSPEYDIMIKSGKIVTFRPEIHPVWYRLNKSIRASSPGEVDTLIRIKKILRKSKRFRKIGGIVQKVVSLNIIHINVYNWRTKTFIGRWVLDPGELNRGMVSSEEIDRIIKITSNETLLQFIESMPVRHK